MNEGIFDYYEIVLPFPLNPYPIHKPFIKPDNYEEYDEDEEE